MMMRKIVAALLLIALVLVVPPAKSVNADAGEVLLVYNNKDEMATISNLIRACGMVPTAIDSVAYSSDIIKNYEYIVLQDATPLGDVLQSDKRPVCIGNEFKEIPGMETDTINRKMHAQLDVYNNTQSVIISQELTYITSHGGEPVGSMSFNGQTHPLGVITDSIMFAPYLNQGDMSAFAVAEMLNVYFGKQDGGKMYIMVDEVYPFDDIDTLQMTAEKFYENGMPFIMSIMPVYYNTDYPAYKRYTDTLRYIQSKSGSLVMHYPLVTDNELVGESLEDRMETAYESLEQNGVHVYDEKLFPYEVSLDMLMRIEPQNELFISLPIDTVIKFDVFDDEAELDAAIDAINKKWLQIGDYGRHYTDDTYLYQAAEIDEDYIYKEKDETSFEFLVDAGNQILTLIVLISGVIIIVLIIVGYRLYKAKFLRRRMK